MPNWLSRHDDGRHFQKHPRTLYGDPYYQKYSDIISQNEPTQAVKLMESEFQGAEHAKQVRIKRALVQQANREKVAWKNTNLSREARGQAYQRWRIYKVSYEKMDVS